jgi:hypothetical protein
VAHGTRVKTHARRGGQLTPVRYDRGARGREGCQRPLEVRAFGLAGKVVAHAAPDVFDLPAAESVDLIDTRRLSDKDVRGPDEPAVGVHRELIATHVTTA